LIVGHVSAQVNRDSAEGQRWDYCRQAQRPSLWIFFVGASCLTIADPEYLRKGKVGYRACFPWLAGWKPIPRVDEQQQVWAHLPYELHS
jgi:hypothetical protein